MAKKATIISIILVLVIATVGIVLSRSHLKGFVPKRQNEEQIIVYHDSNQVELYYHNPSESSAVEIRVEFCIGDGPVEVTRGQVQPGETVTLLTTRDGEPYNYFTPGVFTGRILVYDLDSGKLKERIEPLEFRIYSSYRDRYDSLQPPEEYEREIVLEERDYRPERLKIRVDLKTEELDSGFYGLMSEWRDLRCYVYAEIDGEEILLAKAERIEPRSIVFQLYLEPGVADMLSVGDVLPNAHVDSYYVDNGEFYDSIPAEISEVVRTD